MSIAIGPEGGKKVHLWCDNIRRHKDGKVSFSVINGAWGGSIKDGVVHVDEAGTDIPGQAILWEGKSAPGDYNEAIAWIEKQL